MGCKVSVLKERTVNQNPVVFPLSLYQKALVQESWPIIENQALIFGTGVFYKMFLSKPEMANMFPDVKGVEDLDNMLQQQKLSGHPRIIVNTLQDAVASLNDAGLFVSKMEYVGSLMVEFAISTEQLKNVASAVDSQVQDLIHGEIHSDEILQAWRELFSFICVLMKRGHEKKLSLNKNK
ncbi:globin-like isoform X2 [Rhopilema esculentum]